MKKWKFVSIVAITFLLLDASGMVATADMTSNTSVGVTPGSLSIDSVPDLSFTSNVANIANNASTTVNLNDAGDIHTTDDQGEGTNTNWTLSSMPNFSIGAFFLFKLHSNATYYFYYI